jgi:hypothetical protein
MVGGGLGTPGPAGSYYLAGGGSAGNGAATGGAGGGAGAPGPITPLNSLGVTNTGGGGYSGGSGGSGIVIIAYPS